MMIIIIIINHPLIVPCLCLFTATAQATAQVQVQVQVQVDFAKLTLLYYQREERGDRTGLESSLHFVFDIVFCVWILDFGSGGGLINILRCA